MKTSIKLMFVLIAALAAGGWFIWSNGDQQQTSNEGQFVTVRSEVTLQVTHVSEASGIIRVRGAISNWTAIAGFPIQFELRKSDLTRSIKAGMWCDLDLARYQIVANSVVAELGDVSLIELADTCDSPSISIRHGKESKRVQTTNSNTKTTK